jgi:phospholipase C
VHGKLYAGLAYRYVDYQYYSEGTLPQNLAEANLTWRIYKKISLSVYYEGTFEKVHQYNRIYGQLNLGF